MHLCFVDESGTPAKPNAVKPCFFAMVGLVVPEERWHRLASQLHGLKTRRAYRGELKWRYFAPNNADPDNPMRNWLPEDKNAMRDDLFSAITLDRSIQIVAGVSECAAAYSIPGIDSQQDIYFRTYKLVTERFQYLLQDITRASGHRTLGIIVADHRGKGDDERIRLQHQRLVEDNRQYTSTYNNLVEGLFLAPSHMSVGIQMVDMVAGAIGRLFEANDPYWYGKIRPSLRKSAMGVVDGFGIARFPKKRWTGPVPE